MALLLRGDSREQSGKSEGRESLVVVKFAIVPSSLLTLATIILLTATAIAQEPVTFYEKPASQPLISSINFIDEANSLARAHPLNLCALVGNFPHSIRNGDEIS